MEKAGINKRWIGYIIISILLMSIAFGVTQTIDSFYNQDNPFNIKFIGGDKQSYYLRVPRYAYIENVTLTGSFISNLTESSLSGLNYSSSGTGNTTKINTVSGQIDGVIAYYSLNNSINDTTKQYNGSLLSSGSFVSSASYEGLNLSTTPPVGYFNLPGEHLGDRMDNEKFSISFWVYNYNFDSAIRKHFVFLRGGTNIDITYQRTDNFFEVKVTDTTGLETRAVNFSNPILHTWYHIVFTYNPTGNMTLYVNNNLTMTQTAFPELENDAIGNRIGSGTAGEENYGIDAIIDEIMFINDTLTSYEIANLYSIFATLYIDKSYNLSRSDVSFNVSYINKLLGSDCPSPNYIDDPYCMINTTFYSGTPGILSVNLTNATYSYGIDNCTNSFNIPSNASAFNLTAKDQLTDSNLASNISYEITYGSGNIYAGSEEKTTYEFCKYPAWYNETGIIYADVDVSGYNPYTFNRYDIYFSGQDYYAYLLEEDADHSQISYKLIDVNNEPVEEAIFLVYRSIGGVDTLVFEGKTDITGQVNLYQDTTYQYDYIILASGFPEKNFSLQPQEQTSEPDYTIKLSTESTSYFDNPYQGIRYKHIPEDIIFNNSGEWINLSFVLQGSNLEEVGMRFTDHNFTCIPASCEDIIYDSNGGAVTVSVRMNHTGVLTGAYWFKPEGGERIYVNDNKIKVSNFVASALKKFTELLQDIKANTSANQRTILTAGISAVVIGLAAALGLFGALLIIPAVLVNIVLSLPAVGLINPFVGMIMSIFGIGMFILFSMSSRTI